jgi:hypothetical protein
MGWVRPMITAWVPLVRESPQFSLDKRRVRFSRWKVAGSLFNKDRVGLH